MRRFRDIPNVNFGVLNNSKNKHLVKYDVSTNQYSLIPMDTVLTKVSQSQEIPQDFIDQVEEEVDAANLSFDGVDGGSF